MSSSDEESDFFNGSSGEYYLIRDTYGYLLPTKEEFERYFKIIDQRRGYVKFNEDHPDFHKGHMYSADWDSYFQAITLFHARGVHQQGEWVKPLKIAGAYHLK